MSRNAFSQPAFDIDKLRREVSTPLPPVAPMKHASFGRVVMNLDEIGLALQTPQMKAWDIEFCPAPAVPTFTYIDSAEISRRYRNKPFSIDEKLGSLKQGRQIELAGVKAVRPMNLSRKPDNESLQVRQIFGYFPELISERDVVRPACNFGRKYEVEPALPWGLLGYLVDNRTLVESANPSLQDVAEYMRALMPAVLVDAFGELPALRR